MVHAQGVEPCLFLGGSQAPHRIGMACMMVEKERIELSSSGCKPGALPLSYNPKPWYRVRDLNPCHHLERVAS